MAVTPDGPLGKLSTLKSEEALQAYRSAKEKGPAPSGLVVAAREVVKTHEASVKANDEYNADVLTRGNLLPDDMPEGEAMFNEGLWKSVKMATRDHRAALQSLRDALKQEGE